MFNLPDLGKLPGAKIGNRNRATPSKSTIELNSGLAAIASALNQSKDVNIIPVNIYSLFNRASELGFTNTTQSCRSRLDVM